MLTNPAGIGFPGKNIKLMIGGTAFHTVSILFQLVPESNQQQYFNNMNDKKIAVCSHQMDKSLGNLHYLSYSNGSLPSIERWLTSWYQTRYPQKKIHGWPLEVGGNTIGQKVSIGSNV